MYKGLIATALQEHFADSRKWTIPEDNDPTVLQIPKMVTAVEHVRLRIMERGGEPHAPSRETLCT